MKTSGYIAAAIAASVLSAQAARVPAAPFAIVAPEKIRGYFDSFAATDEELYTNAIPNAAAADWALSNIPRFTCPDEEIERTYFFRWWTYRKHLRNSKDGWVVTEFLPDVPWGARHNTISCALNHHAAEGKWLRDSRYIDGYLRFMMERGRIVGRGSYSCAPAYAALERAKVTGDYDFAKSLLPLFAKNCEAWETGWRGMGGNFFIGYRPERGLYDIYGDREGTEYNLSSNGARPMVNSMRWADLDATAKIAAKTGDSATAAKFAAKADALAKAVKEKLWNADEKFFTTLERKEGKIDSVCELHGYAPFYFGMALDPAWRVAFGRLVDEKHGFLAPKGLTFPTRDTPKFKQVPNLMGHECQWNGPSWPYATSVALTALARELKAGDIPGVAKEDFAKLLKQYAAQHTLTREDGKTVPWIDEDYDPFTGEWLARKVLLARAAAKGKKVKPKERGKDYNHSTFCDLVISGICGIGADADGKLEVKPLAPESWDWWCVEGVRWHGRDLTVLFDRDGTHFGKGKGLVIEGI